MKETELISIIVPVYQVEQFLATCIESLLHQTYRNIEIILVDDGSIDHSGVICDTYARQDDRIRVHHQENGGLSAARNTGISLAKGSFITFVDSDDFISEHYVERMLLAAMEQNVKLVVCQSVQFSQESEIYDQPDTSDTGNLLQEILEKEEALSRINWRKDNRNVALITAWGKLYHRDLFEDLRFPVGKWHEDEFIAHRIIDQMEQICVIPDQLYYYRQRPGSIMSKRDLKSLILHMVLLEALTDRAYFYKEKHTALAEAAFHCVLNESNSLYDAFSGISGKESKMCRKKIANDFRTLYRQFYGEISRKEKVTGGLFAYVPLLYCLLARIKYERSLKTEK